MMPMRRFVPWALLGLLTVGVAAGIALGVANQPGQTPAQWVAAAFATTARAGTARFVYSKSTSSPNPDLRSSLSGYGVVDFARGDVQATQVEHDVTFGGDPLGTLRALPSTETLGEVGIGRVDYMSFDAPLNRNWMKEDFLSEPPSGLRLDAALDAGLAPSVLEGDPSEGVHDAGPATVGGVATTKYLVPIVPVVVCSGPHDTKALTIRQSPSTVWVDKAGRIVQVRSDIRGQLGPWPELPAGTDPAFAQMSKLVTGKVDTVAILRFSDFGAPVTIRAPKVEVHQGGSESVGSARSVKIKGHGCAS
jgi:hypothetical protein